MAVTELRDTIVHLETRLKEAGTSDSAVAYKRNLGAAVRGLWTRILSPDDFFWSMGSSIDRGLTRAWTLGAAEGGLTPDEFTPEEQAELKRHIFTDRMALAGFERRISSTPSREEGGKLGPHLQRLNAWVNHWWEVYALARAMATKDQKMKCVRVKPTKKPCASCAALQGRVYRHSVWLANNCIFPTRRTICGGFLCGHRLQPTTDRITPGRFPASVLK